MAMCKVSASLHFDNRLPSSPNREVSEETYWLPNTDVYVTDTGLVIRVEIAGIRREELELTAEGNRLKINGFRTDGCREAKCKFLVMEINYGAFKSVIEVPPGYDLSRARAIYQNGFLRIDVPELSRPSQKPHSVPISSEES
ncbi:MAG: Hsp20/alpha crystallin family protein [Candidatus Omnitrophica bacterium]|nr:Hsp20/alpha crystallin family protein [Candidatus Omnitrophota bacterium]